jgi:hypothetical protein
MNGKHESNCVCLECSAYMGRELQSEFMRGKHETNCNCVECIAYLERELQCDFNEWMPTITAEIPTVLTPISNRYPFSCRELGLVTMTYLAHTLQMSTANTSALHTASEESYFATDSAGVASTQRDLTDVNARISNVRERVRASAQASHSLTFDAVSSCDIIESSSSNTHESLSSNVNFIRTASRITGLENEESKEERNRNTRKADRAQRQRTRRAKVSQRQLVVSRHPENYIIAHYKLFRCQSKNVKQLMSADAKPIIIKDNGIR